MRKLLFLLLFFNYSFFSFAQSTTSDSLSRLISKATEDTSRIMLIYELARSYVFSKPDTALFLNRQGVELARKINFKKGEATCLRGIGNFFITTGNYPAALSTELEALKIAEQIQDEQLVARLIRSISDVYFYQGDIKRSVEYSHRAITISEKLKDTMGLRSALVSLGDTYEKKDQLDSGLFYTTLAYKVFPKNATIEDLGIVLSNLGNVFRKMGKTDSAIIYYRAAIPYFEQTNNVDGFSELYLGMANIFLQRDKKDSALYYARLSYNIAVAAGFTDKVLAASNFLADYYKSVRNVDSAYAYQAVTIAAKDSMFSQQKTNQMQSITYEEDMRQQQIEDAKEQERVRAKQNALIGGLVALLIVAFLLIRNNRQKQKANKLLRRQKQEIDQKAKDLEQSYNNVELLGDIGRRITSSLSVATIISTVYDSVNSLMDASVFGIGIYHEDTKQIDFPATYENGVALPPYSNSIYEENRLASLCFISGKEMVMGDVETEHKNYLQHMPAPKQGQHAVSLIYLPLKAKERMFGVITVQSFQKNAYSDYHLYMLRTIALYAAIALENAESYKKLNQTVDSLTRTQSQLIQSEKMASLGELTAGIAHEIQNPLNFVNNFAEVNVELIEELADLMDTGDLQSVNETFEDMKRNLEKIRLHGRRADSIVKGMLQHSQSSTGSKEQVDINALTDEYLRLAYHGLRAKDKSFNAITKTEFDHKIDKINVVPQDIGRVLLNLINNAYYTVNEKKKVNQNGYEPMVTVTTVQHEGKVKIKVKDNGNGIPPKILDKIFQPFFTTKPTGQGTGLGLSLAYDIVKAHGGEIKVETQENEGTEFTMVLAA